MSHAYNASIQRMFTGRVDPWVGRVKVIVNHGVTSATKRWSGAEGHRAGTERRAGVIEIGWGVERALALRKNALK